MVHAVRMKGLPVNVLPTISFAMSPRAAHWQDTPGPLRSVGDDVRPFSASGRANKDDQPRTHPPATKLPGIPSLLEIASRSRVWARRRPCAPRFAQAHGLAAFRQVVLRRPRTSYVRGFSFG